MARMTDTPWGVQSIPEATSSQSANNCADLRGITQAVTALDGALAGLAGAYPTQWVAPSVAFYRKRVDHLRGMIGTGRSLTDHARVRVQIYNQAVNSNWTRASEGMG
jgi:hypothetical protein